jgi:hypothetical protein
MIKCYDDSCHQSVPQDYTYCEGCKEKHYPPSTKSVETAIQKLKQWGTVGRPTTPLSLPPQATPEPENDYTNVGYETLRELEQKAEKWLTDHPDHPNLPLAKKRYELIKKVMDKHTMTLVS